MVAASGQYLSPSTILPPQAAWGGGEETIRKLREINPEVRAIVSSGYSNDPVMASFRDFGFSGIIAKPFRAGKLGQVLQQVIAGG